MREIKFNFYNTISQKYTTWEESNAGMPMCSFSTHKHLKFLQFTGLKDKNGKEVFEGDIVRINSDFPDEFHEVKFACGGFMAGELFLDDYWNLNGHMFEVVGNKFDNPDLVDEGEEE
ncbi:YopX family protein [Bacillus sp. JJ1566]|uniref:YopX family protein n=1 Tax=Bacillus sp. JJ1566 TaxID=3122961 RepID=UPI0030009AA8